MNATPTSQPPPRPPPPNRAQFFQEREGRNQYTDTSSNPNIGLTSPLSPNIGSDFSFSKYHNDDTFNSSQRLIPGFPLQGSTANDGGVANSGFTNSLLAQRTSNGSQNNPRDSVVMEHYVALKKYLVRHLAAEGMITYLVL